MVVVGPYINGFVCSIFSLEVPAAAPKPQSFRIMKRLQTAPPCTRCERSSIICRFRQVVWLLPPQQLAHIANADASRRQALPRVILRYGASLRFTQSLVINTTSAM
jgi:hypothetical protein